MVHIGEDVRPAADSSEGIGEITALLRAWSAGDSRAEESLFSRVYPELKRLAAKWLGRRGGDVSIQATGLVSEVYLRLVKQR